MGFFKSFKRTLGKGISGIGKVKRIGGSFVGSLGIPVVSQIGKAAAAEGQFETTLGRQISGSERFDAGKLAREGVKSGVEVAKAIQEVKKSK